MGLSAQGRCKAIYLELDKVNDTHERSPKKAQILHVVTLQMILKYIEQISIEIVVMTLLLNHSHHQLIKAEYFRLVRRRELNLQSENNVSRSTGQQF